MPDDAGLPPWLPVLVAKRARELYNQSIESGSTEEATLAVRIASDVRMRRVWQTLQSKWRDPRARGKYRYPVVDPASDCGSVHEGFGARAEWIQQVSLQVLYEDIFLWTKLRESPSRWISRFQLEANELRERARFPWIGVPPALLGKRELHLLRAADACEAIARADELDMGRNLPAAIAAQVGYRLNTIFGTPLYGTTATITSVILGVTVTGSEAREHCRGRWSVYRRSGKSPQKRG